MSLTPDPSPQVAIPEPAPPPRTWQSRLLNICFVIFTFEVGLFLAIVPWTDETWNFNSLQEMVPLLQSLWVDPYFKGAITGLGLVNIYIACHEVLRLVRRAG